MCEFFIHPINALDPAECSARDGNVSGNDATSDTSCGRDDGVRDALLRAVVMRLRADPGVPSRSTSAPAPAPEPAPRP